MMNLTPLGIRLNNPGCIFKTDVKWKGEIESPHENLCKFETPEFGIRAMGIILRTYQTKHNIRTIGQAINRYAPPSINDTDSYIADVCRRTSIGRNSIISFTDPNTLQKIVRAIIWHENGQQPYPDAMVRQALATP